VGILHYATERGDGRVQYCQNHLKRQERGCVGFLVGGWPVCDEYGEEDVLSLSSSSLLLWF
jgi:hypothetical protein